MPIERTMRYSDFKASLPFQKAKSDPLLCKLLFRPLSLPVGWLLYRMRFSGNSVTIGSILVAIVAFGLLLSGHHGLSITAAVLLMLVALGDCVDGNIARARGESGPGGEWMDALSGYTVYALLPLVLGLHLELAAGTPFPGGWVLLGAVTAISNLFLRLVYQKFSNVMASSGNEGLESKGSLFSRVSGELGLVGWMMPALLIAIILGLEVFYLIFYCLFYSAAAVVATFILGRRILTGVS